MGELGKQRELELIGIIEEFLRTTFAGHSDYCKAYRSGQTERNCDCLLGRAREAVKVKTPQACGKSEGQ